MSQPPSPEAAASLTTAAPGSLSGRRVVLSGLVCGAVGLAIALFVRALLANTSVRLPSTSLFWGTVLGSGFAVVAGMALEAVRQLQRSNPDPAYRHGRRARRPLDQGRAGR